MNPLHTAIAGGDAATVERLLSAGADANAEHQDIPALFAAVRSDQPEIVDQLLRAGAQPNKLVLGARTALSVAAAFRWGRHHDHVDEYERAALQIIDRLLAASADPNLGADPQWFPITAAAQAGSTAVFERLLSAGARLRDDTISALLSGSCEDRFRSLLLLAERADQFPLRESLLGLAARPGQGAPDTARALLALGAPVDVADEETGATPLLYAVYWSDEELVRLLASAGASLDVAARKPVWLDDSPIPKGTSPRSLLAQRHASNPEAEQPLVLAAGVSPADLQDRMLAGRISSVVGLWTAFTIRYESSPDDDADHEPFDDDACADALAIEFRADGTCSLSRHRVPHDGNYHRHGTRIHMKIGSETHQVSFDTIQDELIWSENDEEHGSKVVTILRRQ